MRYAIIALLLLAGCSSPGKDAEAEYAMVEKRGDADEICTAARRVEAAYLGEHNEPKYDDWKSRADTLCLSARVRREVGLH